MLFQKKIDEAMKRLKEKRIESEDKENKEYLEKGDILAIIISALLVFGPIILILVFLLKWIM